MDKRHLKQLTILTCAVALAAGCGGSGAGGTRIFGGNQAAGATFLVQPTNVQTSTSGAPVAMADIQVRVIDASGFPATGTVTLSIENDPAWGILLNDGENVVVYDPVGGGFTDTGVNAVGWDEPAATARHPSVHDGRLMFFGRNGDAGGLLAPDGVETTLFTGVYPFATVGAAFFDPAGRLLIGESETDDTGGPYPLYEMNPATGTVSVVGNVAVPGEAISNWVGVSRHPQTGVYYAVVGLNSDGTSQRRILQLDPVGLTGSNLVNLAQPAVSDIAFAPDGTLYATTGNELGGNSDTLWTIDSVATGTMTLVGDFQQAGFGDGAGLGIATSELSTTSGAAGLTVALDANGEATFTGVTIHATNPANGAGFTLRVLESTTQLTAVSDPFTVGPVVP